VHEKEQAFHRLQTAPDSKYLKVRQVCDLWCAIWFWPVASAERGTRSAESSPSSIPHSPLRIPHSEIPPPPTTQTALELMAALLGTEEDVSLSAAEQAAYWDVVKQVWREQRFFHWELEFPEVWREKNGTPKKNGGFHAIVGNPPWDALSPDTKEFFSNYEPLFSHFIKQEANQLISDLFLSSEISTAWRKYADSIMQQVHFVRRSGLYDWFAPGNLGKGDQNLYRFFVERNFSLLRVDGLINLVLPDGIYSGANATKIRQELMKKSRARMLFAFENRRHVFADIDTRSKIALIFWQKGKTTDSLPYRFYVGKDAAGEVLGPSLDELPFLLQESFIHPTSMQVTLINRLAPETMAVPEIQTYSDVRILTYLMCNF